MANGNEYSANIPVYMQMCISRRLNTATLFHLLNTPPSWKCWRCDIQKPVDAQVFHNVSKYVCFLLLTRNVGFSLVHDLYTSLANCCV